MSDNGDGAKLVVKAELIDKNLKITFGEDVPPLLFDRAVRLINLQLDNMLIAVHQPVVKIIKPQGSVIGDINDLLRGHRGA
ncbi:MAG: hypothetical protein KKE30_01735 [Gammaproteobacteria bacterium]|nr:hypothetical protein [Gammaproteobacteria bacterium]